MIQSSISFLSRRAGLVRDCYLRTPAIRARKLSASPRTDIGVKHIDLSGVTTEWRGRLLATLRDLPCPYSQPERHSVAAHTAVASLLPPSSISAIRTFHSSPYGPGALLLSGLPVDSRLPQTPADGGRSAEKQSFISEGCLTGVSGLIGEPFGYESEKNGDVIHNVCPVRNRETVQSNESSRGELGLHVENAYFDSRPDYLALYCLRQDHKKEARTSFVDIRSVILRLDPEDVAELQKPAFVVPSPLSHHDAMGGEMWSTRRPVFETFEHPNFCCHFPRMKALEPRAQKALDNLERMVRHPDVLHLLALEPGSILLLNNRKVAHGRTLFEPRYDGADRWLQRVYIRKRQ